MTPKEATRPAVSPSSWPYGSIAEILKGVWLPQADLEGNKRPRSPGQARSQLMCPCTCSLHKHSRGAFKEPWALCQSDTRH